MKTTSATDLDPFTYGEVSAAPCRAAVSTAPDRTIRALVGLRTEVPRSPYAPIAGFRRLPRPIDKVLALALVAGLSGCAALFGERPTWGPAAVPVEVADALRLSTVGVRGTVLRLMGGPRHEVYLGCLSCPSGDPDAILNPDGPHGRLDGERSIWNPRSAYGGKSGAYSPWNPSPVRPPVAVTEYGHTYGVLTVAPTWAGKTIEPGLKRLLAVMGVYAP